MGDAASYVPNYDHTFVFGYFYYVMIGWIISRIQYEKD